MTFEGFELYKDALERLRSHSGHALAIAEYGEESSVAECIAIECETCHEVLVDFVATEPDKV